MAIKVQPLPKLRKSYTVIFAISFLLMMSFALIAIVLLRQAQYDRDRIDHRRKLQAQLDGIIISIMELESMNRAYLLTRDQQYLSDYGISEKSLQRNIEDCYPLTRNSTIQRARLDTVQVLVKQRLKYLNEVRTAFIFTNRYDSLLMETKFAEGNALTRQIEGLLKRMSDSEKQFVVAASKSLLLYNLRTYLLIGVFGLVTALITVFGFISILRENNRKQKAEENLLKTMAALQESEIRYRSLNEVSNDAIIICDEHGQIISWNPAAEDIFGFKPEEVLRKHLSVLMPNEFKDLLESELAQYKASGRSRTLNHRVEIRGLHKSGRQFPIEITLGHWKVENMHYFSAAVRDITVQKKAQERLQVAMEDLKRSNESLEQFAYVASHDLQEPLRKIRSFGDRLITKFDSNGTLPGREYVDRMIDGAERMQVLIHDLLSFSRVSRDAGNKGSVDLNLVIKQVLDDLQISILESGAIITKDKMPVLTSVNVLQIHQLVLNLLNNAVKFRKTGVRPEISISCDLVAGSQIDYPEITANPSTIYYQIAIEDNGIGFDQKHLDKIFTIFQRLHGRTEYQGTGIGLAICEKICKNHDGFITARSEKDKGSTFIVFLPKLEV